MKFCYYNIYFSIVYLTYFDYVEFWYKFGDTYVLPELFLVQEYKPCSL